ncbi:unnamed protein product [Discosporangium mesarthrocarpum]
MRMRGTEMAEFLRQGGSNSGVGGGFGGKGRRIMVGGRGRGERGVGRGEEVAPTPVGRGRRGEGGKWRQQSSQFRAAIRQARVVSEAQKAGKSLSDLPPPEPSAPDPSLVPCPFCGRTFNEQAAERHIGHCKDARVKPTSLKKGSGKGLGQRARAMSSTSHRGGRW